MKVSQPQKTGLTAVKCPAQPILSQSPACGRAEKECPNLNCWLVKNLNYSPYKRCRHCNAQFRQCIFLHFQAVSAVLVGAIIVSLFIFDGRISTAVILSIFAMVVAYGFFFNKTTDQLIEANFAQAQTQKELEELAKNLEKRVKKATAKLEVANKELQRLDDAKSEFLSIASHQLRTPATVIKGYVSMMQEGSFGELSQPVHDNLVKVATSTERLLNLIENLLDISRIEAGRLEFDIQPVDLGKVANELAQDFTPKAQSKKLKLAVYVPAKLPTAAADYNKVKEVASNLIDNAIKYTPQGEVTVNLHPEGSSVVLSVEDTGQGFSTEDYSRLFKKFSRGDQMNSLHPEGTGLGLYFARVVVENMGGRIWAESAGKGKGSKFCFSLPMADKKKAGKVK